MINREILKELIPVTDEEQAILDGRSTVDSSIYTENDDNIISAKKLLKDGKLITIRTHTRFIHFPEHTHDFVEVVYMCSGKTTHIINGKRIDLFEGELLFLGQNAKQEILPASGNDIAVNFIVLPQFFNKTLEMLGTEETPLKKFLIEALFKEENLAVFGSFLKLFLAGSHVLEDELEAFRADLGVACRNHGFVDHDRNHFNRNVRFLRCRWLRRIRRLRTRVRSTCAAVVVGKSKRISKANRCGCDNALRP